MMTDEEVKEAIRLLLGNARCSLMELRSDLCRLGNSLAKHTTGEDFKTLNEPLQEALRRVRVLEKAFDLLL